MDTDYGMITTDFIPNEVCDFAEGRYGSYQRDFDYHRDPEANLIINEADLYGLTQMKDSADYFRSRRGREDLHLRRPHRLGRERDDEHRQTAPRDDPVPRLPEPRRDDDQRSRPGWARRARSAALVASVTTALGLFGAALIEKDLWWPDADDTEDARQSRGVMTHEYGHFAMCSLLFAENGPPGLTGLIARVFEGQDDSRDDEVAQMTEAWRQLRPAGRRRRNYIQGGR